VIDISRSRTELAKASRVLAHHRIVDAYGHVSCRHPQRGDCFLMSRSKAPALVTPGDIIEIDLDGNLVTDSEATMFLERFIHSELYRARSDVEAIVHSHAPEVLPYTVVTEAPLRPICHLCGFLDGVGPPFNVSQHLGHASDQLISSKDLGRQFAQHFGARNVGLIRAHGFTAVAESLPMAVFRAIYTSRNCQIDSAARLLGSPDYLSAADAAACEITTHRVAERAWELWLHELSEAGGNDWM
jgi:HCOMODA/2-hydroxy-3-carboxy-muconic semialdehyde decarboxylase